MKVLIQNCRSNQYFAGGNNWVGDPDRAVAFPSSAAAMEYMHECNLHPAKVVLKFPQDRYDMAVSKTPDC